MTSLSNLGNFFRAIDHHHRCSPDVKLLIGRCSSHPPNFSRNVLRAQLTDTISAVGSQKVSKDEVMKAEERVIVGTYGRSPLVLTNGKGCKLYDIEGREYIDLTSGIAVNALGHGDPDWIQAITDQANLLAHVSNIYYTLPQVNLAERLVASSFADRVFFSNSGTEANEAAIKFARKFQKISHPDKTDPPTEFISFTNSFHGRTIGSLALTSKEHYRTPFEPVMPGVTFLNYGDIDAAQELISSGKIAAVQCGLGRTGYLWAHEAYDVTPDIMTLAKPLAGGLPIGATLVTERVNAAIKHGDHGSTFAGGPLVCAAAIAVFDKISKPVFLASVTRKGEYLKEILMKKVGGNSHVKEIRGFGLIVGIELDVSASRLVDACRESGLLILTAGKGDIVRLVPPLIISEQELDQTVEILYKCFDVLDEKNLN
ncbi:hypothetical protein Ccrd_022700 [Cynara cardunculus var. scolymus]|uniref:Acetylornithine transaminase n=1 Tax=Cynara cardunculus var. scolymus TaxID=59895 RepID=A0A103XY57_CYNCS|nr:hypothetical protein Ccrd_022700 [Cynara cardunculus var. scolymus]